MTDLKQELTAAVWATMKSAALYALWAGIGFLALAALLNVTVVPSTHSDARRAVDGALLFSIYGAAGAVCGFLFGVSTLRHRLEGLAAAFYQTVRAAMPAVSTGLGGDLKYVSPEQLRRFITTDLDTQLAAVTERMGFVGRPCRWILRGPVNSLRKSVLGELVPLAETRNVTGRNLEDFLAKRAGRIACAPIEAKLKAALILSIGIGIAAVALPLIVIRFV
jgi:hypothetical protein